ncbi:unnamed protein product [Eruca vesicaria subsp. sativa]|uniref:RBR-type E3 ubiquitin transferase n=1 Tax=Eruca vesicaria subsp. sativa TaxID=29727 RepID=A0ABC8J1A4_ERUVS|nr:unnamed protein product [Eruca vesicaria subsp. sativa]
MDDDYMSFEEDEDDYDCFDDDRSYQEDYYEEPDLQGVSSKKPTCQIITMESLVAAQKEVLVTVMEYLSVKESQARTLLIHYQWNVDKLFAVYIDRGKDSLFKSAGLTVFDHPSLSNSRQNMACGICMEDDLPSHAMTRMECGHFFCNDCWKEHFTIKINEGQSKRIACMAHKCNAICDEDVVRKLVCPEIAEKFDRFLVESYVDDNKLVKWCPSTPHCGNAIRKVDDEGGQVECYCGHQFCFTCLSESHSPCSCLMWKLWTKKCEAESESVTWLTIHTRMCPKCSKPVHKSVGCNLVTCICGQHFCWLCGGATGLAHDWNSIAGHSCGKYKEDKVRQKERAKRDLDRYAHYLHQYKSHTDSSKQEDKLREFVREKAALVTLKTKDSAFKDMDWAINGADLLFRSRRILSYSYPFAFYMFGEELFQDEMSDEDREIKKNLFENQQQELTGNIETLSKLLDVPFDEYSSDELEKMRCQTRDIGLVVDKVCKLMYECIEDDLLGTAQDGRNHIIAPYRSEGIEKAVEFLC